LTGLNTIGVIKQCLITPFMDNRSERKNSVFIIGVNPIDKEKTLCPQILKKLDVTYRQK